MIRVMAVPQERGTPAWCVRLAADLDANDQAAKKLVAELTEEQLRDKIALLLKAYLSQVPHDWFDEEVYAGLARLRGMECRAPYAEAFTTAKATMTW